MKGADNIFMEILTPEKVLIEAQVTKVSLPATKGRFMVLKGHAPLISSLEEGDVSYMSGGVGGSVHIVSGFVEICDDKVTICAEL